MRYRNLTTNKIENLEAQLKSLRFMVNRGQPVQNFLQTLDKSEEILSEVKALIQAEPLSPEEGFGLQ